MPEAKPRRARTADISFAEWYERQHPRLVAERQMARQARDFARSDELRRQLADLGVVVEDRDNGASTWRWG